MNYKRERLVTIIDEVAPFVVDYFARTKAQESVPPIDIDWDQYLTADINGRLTVITARSDDGHLCGFVMYVVGPNPHYRDVFFATCDILAVSPECRGQGIASMLVRSAEALFRPMGVERMIHYFRTIYDVEPLFPKLGFVEAERTYMKVL